MSRIGILAAAAVLASAALPAAASTVYSDINANAATAAAAFDAAVGSFTLQDFEGFADGAQPSWSYGAGTATLDGALGVTTGYPYGGGPTSGSKGYIAYTEFGAGSPVFTFSAPIRAFGAYIVDLELPAQITVTLSGGGVELLTPTIAGDGGLTFFGFDYGSAAITGVSIALHVTDAVLLDDVRIATGAAVPEPGAWALMIAGFGLAGAALRNRRRAAPVLAR